MYGRMQSLVPFPQEQTGEHLASSFGLAGAMPDRPSLNHQLPQYVSWRPVATDAFEPAFRGMLFLPCTYAR